MIEEVEENEHCWHDLHAEHTEAFIHCVQMNWMALIFIFLLYYVLYYSSGKVIFPCYSHTYVSFIVVNVCSWTFLRILSPVLIL